jgi:MFS family permease
LVAVIPGEYSARREGAPKRPMRSEIADGLRWLWRHRLLRTLAVMVGIINLTPAGCIAVMVLFAQDILGLGSVGYGLLLTGLAIGGVAGGFLTAPLRQWLGTGRLLVAVVVTTGLTLLVVGLSSDAWVVGALVAMLGVPMVAWNVVTVSLRQAVVPDELFGRINSIYKLLGLGTMPIGAVLGGSLGYAFGLRAPFLVAPVIVLRLAAATGPALLRTPMPDGPELLDTFHPADVVPLLTGLMDRHDVSAVIAGVPSSASSPTGARTAGPWR